MPVRGTRATVRSFAAVRLLQLQRINFCPTLAGKRFFGFSLVT